MLQPNDLSRSLTALDQDSTLIAVIEMSQSSWLVGAIIPGVERRPAKKLEASEGMLLALLHRWRDEAAKAGRTIARITVAFEAGRDGLWLARRLRARGFEAHVIPATSIALSREHRRAKTDRLGAALRQRAFLGWLRGERGQCTMVAVASLAEEDAKRPSREREALVGERTRIGNRVKSTLARLGIRGIRRGHQAGSAQGSRAARTVAHARGRPAAAQHAGRAASRSHPAALDQRSNRRD